MIDSERLLAHEEERPMRRRTYITSIALALTLSGCATAPRAGGAAQPAAAVASEPPTTWVESLSADRPVTIDTVVGDGREALIIIVDE